MEAVPPVVRPGNRDRGFSDTFATRPRIFNERDPMRHGSSPAGRENRSPSNVPKGLENMLKTTTETGDIGMFSIKPSRVPYSLTTPRRMGTNLNELGIQKTRQTFQPYGVPVIDDRRRLPSYARDASSEVLSMYETASQKSASRNCDDPDYRSYSMTQTSYSSYTLSNHRSYTSLRSYVDGSGLVQRPRSPFAYPTRLKRPGFRPSSPALTDGGAIDYSRRVEIDRAAYGNSQNVASPSSLYAQKRKLPLPLRHEANRSTPSLLGQSSPPRRSSSPLVPRQNGLTGNDWQRRNVTMSGNTSPARSTLSLASKVNLYSKVPISSTTTTPGKLHPPSPLYYDYTEDFEFETCHRPENVDLPPQFRIEKTIPEDQPMSAYGPAREVQQHKPGEDGNYLLAMTGVLSERKGKSEDERGQVESTEMLKREAMRGSYDGKASSEKTTKRNSEAGENKKVVRLSGLGAGARELSCHVEEAFGLPSSTSFVIDVCNAGKEETNVEGELAISGAEAYVESEKESHSARTSSYSLGSQFPQFPYPPGAQEETKTAQGSSQTHPINYENERHSGVYSRGANEKGLSRRTSKESQCLPPSGRPRARSSGFNPIDTGLAKSEEPIEGSNKPRETKQDLVATHLGRTLMNSPTIPARSKMRSGPNEDSRAPLLSTFNQQRGRELQMLAQRQPLKRNNYRVRRVEPSDIVAQNTRGVPNFSHQIPHKAISRSESPMLAPKPISPARQLKLKNSIPQLMKALPPVPPEPPFAASSIDQIEEKAKDVACLSSLLVAGMYGNTLAEVSKSTSLGLETKLPVLCEDQDEPPKAPESAGVGTREDTSEQDKVKTSAPKLKLKVKSSLALRAFATPSSQPSSLEENRNRASQDAKIYSSSTSPREKPSMSKQPKFRLRVIRASDSTQGTVRVNRGSESTESPGGLNFQNPNDLFTPSPGIDNLFRQFGKRLHSRKASANSNNQSEESEPIFTRSNASSPVGEAHRVDQAAFRSLAPGAVSGGIFEARSVFSDDSSQVQGHHSLKNRISNLRARIIVPYTTKTGAQSYDDITWKDRNGAQVLPPPTNQSETNLYENRRSSDLNPMRRIVEKLHRQRLKAKVQSWIQGARSVIYRVRHSRAASGSGDGGKFD